MRFSLARANVILHAIQLLMNEPYERKKNTIDRNSKYGANEMKYDFWPEQRIEKICRPLFANDECITCVFEPTYELYFVYLCSILVLECE